ncbi:MAG: SAM-dependent methyltransferase [Alphaproteobacteria bacterium]|nr:SAM-dependent methyltransferase [Alphaproteobacteria bacterium]
MPDLAARIAYRIRREGPLTIAAYMAMALHDPEDGYYARHDPLGRAGDFTTAPEISQIFGELLGFWCADLWQRMGEPDPVILAELGPGRGTLLSDLLRATDRVPGFRGALRLHLVESSPILRRVQRQRLRGASPQFVDRADELPPGPLLLVANEFLDALPIRQLVRGHEHWCERLVTVAPDKDELTFADGPEAVLLTRLIPPALRDAPAGTVVELCPGATALAAELGQRLVREPGAALFIDYGYHPAAAGPSLAALRHHAPADPLAAPGTADLSAHVDFAAFATAATSAGATAHGPVGQGRFLCELGAEARLAALSRAATPGQRATHESAVHRLIDPGQMGTLFKVLALTSPGLPGPAGFAGTPVAGGS